jgi:hypothetical protein
MSGKVLSLFDHPEFVRRIQDRAQRELAERVLPAERVAPSRLRCRRCSLEYEVLPRLPTGHPHDVIEPCPRCEPPADLDALESFLSRLLRDEEPDA